MFDTVSNTVQEFFTILNFFFFISRHNEVYTWNNVNSCVHNIIVGQLWIEQVSNIRV